MSKEAIVSFYIKNGASKLIDYAESSINKKKNKKLSLAEDAINYQPSVMNFIIQKPFKASFNYFCKQILNNMEGKTRIQALDEDQDNLFLQDINSFKKLYKKCLKPPNQTLNSQLESQILFRNIQVSFGQRIFNREVQITQIGQGLRETGAKIEEIKANYKLHTNPQFLKSIEMNGMISRTRRLNYDYESELRMQIQANYNNIFNSKAFSSETFEQSEKMCENVINFTINRWFSLLLEAISMKQLLNCPNIIVQWENNLIQKERHQLIAQQINGKMLFQYQQKINQLKLIIKPSNIIKQSQIRQKKNGIHSLSFQNTDNRKQKLEFVKQFEMKSTTELDKIRLNFNKSQQNNKSYQNMANRVKNLKNCQHSQSKTVSNVKSSNQQIKNELKYQINNQVKNKQSTLNERIVYYKGVKPSPLRPQNISKFKMNSKEKPLQRTDCLSKDKLNLKIIKPVPKVANKIQIKFPLKIQSFEMQSWNFSFLCYKTQKINLKQLPLVFIKDRHKFEQNRVKIEYPCSPEVNDKQLVNKSMQILNCLGAQVFCEEETSYKTVNQIDSIEILTISWLLERPVKQIIEYYGGFYSGCQTKK